MTEITFTIHGNHENPDGNPLAKARFTRRQIFAGYADRYSEWKEHVRAALYDAVLVRGRIRKDLEGVVDAIGDKPLDTSAGKCRMEIFITFAKGNRPDSENVFGSIADAIFSNDKNLAGAFDFDERVGKRGRVDVRIRLTTGSEEPASAGSRLHPRKGKQVAE